MLPVDFPLAVSFQSNEDINLTLNFEIYVNVIGVKGTEFVGCNSGFDAPWFFKLLNDSYGELDYCKSCNGTCENPEHGVRKHSKPGVGLMDSELCEEVRAKINLCIEKHRNKMDLRGIQIMDEFAKVSKEQKANDKPFKFTVDETEVEAEATAPTEKEIEVDDSDVMSEFFG